MQHMTKQLNIAIDGPAGAGKSTIARMVAQELGYIYIDTGAMYRAVTYMALQAGLHSDQADEIAALSASMELRLEQGAEGQLVFVNNVDVTNAIRSVEVASNVSAVAQIGKVRSILVDQQRKLAQAGGVVMDGRDIGSRVLPDADVKIYMTASVEVRALRRYDEMKAKGIEQSFETLLHDIDARDQADKNRSESPLVKAPGAIELDTTHLSIEEVIRTIIELCHKRLREE